MKMEKVEIELTACNLEATKTVNCPICGEETFVSAYFYYENAYSTSIQKCEVCGKEFELDIEIDI